jgi:hypothetical protein
MIIHVKIGTHPQHVYRVYRKRNIKIGDEIKIKPAYAHGAKWFDVRVKEIRDVIVYTLYFVEHV